MYDGAIERLDRTIGLFAEPLPRNFGFSETALRVFLLIASRGLQSERFYTSDYRDEIYPKDGLEWIEEARFARVMVPNYPKLARRLTESNIRSARGTRSGRQHLQPPVPQESR